VTLIEADATAVERGLARIRDHYAYIMQRGRLDTGGMARRLARIHARTELAAATGADLVIEAASESLGSKQELLARVEAIVRPDAILVVHTIGADVEAIAAATSRPAHVIGAHFFAPAQTTRLVEIVRTAQTADDVIATVMALGRRMGKVSVLARAQPGLIGHALFRAHRREALFLVEEGALPHEVDAALEDFGFVKGPFAVMDMAGNDVVERSEMVQPPAAASPVPRKSALPAELVKRGRLGKKNGSGWYRYEEEGRRPCRDPQLEALLVAESARLGIARRSFTREQILERCLFSLVNEGARLLERGIAQRASDIDIVLVAGYGFPAVEGGPMFLADRVGLPRVAAAVRRLHAELGAWWEPAPLLQELAARGAAFASLQVPRR
jgi:3-hydroxyacyl-CoA dehydrogenase